MEIKKLKNILEAVLLATERTLTVIQLEALFELDEERPTRDEVRKALHEMEEDFATRGFELKHVASGYRLQVKQEFATWVGRLWEEKPARYTRALLETMALIAYRQPITRGEIEEVRGVSVSSNIIKTLLERDWIKVLGHKDVPGKPTLYGTTKEFLDYFNLQKLDELPTLAEIKDLDSIHPELELDEDAAKDPAKDPDGTDTDESAANDSAVHNTEANDTEANAGASNESAQDMDEQGHVEAVEEFNSADDVSDTVEEVSADTEQLDASEEESDANEESVKAAFNV